MRRAVRAFFLAVALVSCDRASSPHRIAPLSTTDRANNANKIAQFIEQQCFDRADDVVEFEAGLRAVGWQSKRTQTADPAKPLELDVWELPNVTVLRGQPVMGGAWTCSVDVKSPVAPALDQIKTAMSMAIGKGPDKNGEWWLNRTSTRRLHVTADQGVVADAGDIFVNVEIYKLPWWRGLLG